MIGRKLYGYYHDNKQYEQLRAQVSSNSTLSRTGKILNGYSPETASQTAKELSLPYSVEEGNPDELDADGILLDYSALKKQNDELVGWIKMPGFKNPIDYPVMQAEDNWSDKLYITNRLV